MKIYTRTGDKGLTSLIGGTRVPKHHLRIEAYGTVDELNSCIGIIRSQGISPEHSAVLETVQNLLFTIGSQLASDPERSRMKLPDLLSSDVDQLEQEMDRMNEVLPELKNFILPGGDAAASFAHLARCVCRRAERICVHLSEENPVDPLIIQYLNRLSDYLFVLARKISFEKGMEENKWAPRT